MTRSSTSASRRLAAWAAALLALVVLDVGLPRMELFWQALELPPDQGRCGPQSGAVAVQRELANLREAQERPRVIVVGSSRACAGFRPGLAAAESTYRFLSMAHAGINPLVIRSMLPTLEDLSAESVVLVLSEFDTHRPVPIRPPATYGGFAAFWTLVDAMGWRDIRSSRTGLLRLLVADGSRLYRHRGFMRTAGWLDWLDFSSGTQDSNPTGSSWRAFPGENPMLALDRFEELRAEVEQSFPRSIPEAEFAQLRMISPGPHVALQQRLVRETVAELRSAGITVWLVEGPLNPIGEVFFDTERREEYRRFALELAEAPGVEVLAPPTLPEFRVDEFRDLTHLNRLGSERFTRAVLAAVTAESK